MTSTPFWGPDFDALQAEDPRSPPSCSTSSTGSAAACS